MKSGTMDKGGLVCTVSHEVSLRHIVGALVTALYSLSIELEKVVLKCLLCHFPTVGKLHTLSASTLSWIK